MLCLTKQPNLIMVRIADNSWFYKSVIKSIVLDKTIEIVINICLVCSTFSKTPYTHLQKHMH